MMDRRLATTLRRRGEVAPRASINWGAGGTGVREESGEQILGDLWRSAATLDGRMTRIDAPGQVMGAEGKVSADLASRMQRAERSRVLFEIAASASWQG